MSLVNDREMQLSFNQSLPMYDLNYERKDTRFSPAFSFHVWEGLGTRQDKSCTGREDLEI